MKCFEWSVHLYGWETWTTLKKDRERIEAFEMWPWRRILNINMRNEEVLRR